MVSKLIEIELIVTPAGMVLCYLAITLFAISQLINGLHVVVLPLWLGLIIGILILLMINQFYSVSTMKAIENILRIKLIILITIYAVLLLLVLIKVVILNIPVFISITSLLMGATSGILIAACLKVYVSLKYEKIELNHTESRCEE
ncbi:MAG: hypothetical protein ACTSRU_13125 [Candidatus Hodarchaeales archaeon]